MTQTHPEPIPDELHAADAHHVGGGHDHPHDTGGHDHDSMHPEEEHEEPLGPIDWAAWGISALGIGIGALVGLCLFLVTHPV